MSGRHDMLTAALAAIVLSAAGAAAPAQTGGSRSAAPAAEGATANQPATTQPATTRPAEADDRAAADVEAEAGTGAGATESVRPPAEAAEDLPRDRLVARLLKNLQPPPKAQSPAEAQRQLRTVARDAQQLAETTQPGPLRMKATSLHLQALYADLTLYADQEQRDRLLAELRRSARRAQAMDEPQAEAIGAFWLLAAELYEVNTSALPEAERQRQSRALLEDYLERYPQSPAVDAARQTLTQLADAPEAPQDDAPTTQPAATQPATTQPAEAPATRPAEAPAAAPPAPPVPAPTPADSSTTQPASDDTTPADETP